MNKIYRLTHQQEAALNLNLTPISQCVKMIVMRLRVTGRWPK